MAADGRREVQERNHGFSRMGHGYVFASRDLGPETKFLQLVFNTCVESRLAPEPHPCFIRDNPWFRCWGSAAFCGHLRFRSGSYHDALKNSDAVH